MGRDRYERKHRRTWRNPGCMAVMAGADFDRAPELAEAMGLEDPNPRQREALASLYARQAAGERVRAVGAGYGANTVKALVERGWWAVVPDPTVPRGCYLEHHELTEAGRALVEADPGMMGRVEAWRAAWAEHEAARAAREG